MKDKCAVITGGASGIGFCTVEQLLHHNAKRVAILDLPNSNEETAIEKLEEQFGKDRVMFFDCDVTKQEQVESTFKKVVEWLGDIDILINSAGVADDKKWRSMIDTNVTGLIRTSLIGIDLMGKHNGGKGGTILNIASIGGLTPVSFLPIYCATKYAVVGFTASMKLSYDTIGIRMLLMCPGATNTPLLSRNNLCLDFIKIGRENEEMKPNDRQPPEHVAKAIIELIEKGENGAACVVNKGEPPFLVDIPTIFDLPTHSL